MLLPASSLKGQAPETQAASTVSELPRFTLREIVTGSNDVSRRIPGSWLQAALAVDAESLALATYYDVAKRSGVTPLERKALASDRLHHMMGLYRRGELIDAARQTLLAIRAGIPGPATQARFDRLFRPRGEWVIDVHDAALIWARSRSPSLSWSAARPALTAAKWLHPDDSLAVEAVPRALYGLALLAATDSSAFGRIESDMGRADSASAEAVRLLLAGYTTSYKWYTESLEFFLRESWIPDGPKGRSLSDYIAEEWLPLGDSGQDDKPGIPEIRVRLFGYPQAVPQYGVPTALFQRLVVLHNASARSWVNRHGEDGLLRALQLLPSGDTSLVLLQSGSEAIRLTTVPRQSRESLNGFLEPGDAIVIDPGYSPLLALGTVVHEWQHLLFRRRQLQAFAGSLPRGRLELVELPGIEAYLAEGFAEWSTERILAPLHGRWPLLALGELEKRAGLASGDADDQHSVGYALVRALASVLKDPVSTTRLLLDNAEHPGRIPTRPALMRAWRAYRGAPDRVLAVPARKFLIPEVTFTVEDGFPDVVARRIVVPSSRLPDR